MRIRQFLGSVSSLYLAGALLLLPAFTNCAPDAPIAPDAPASTDAPAPPAVPGKAPPIGSVMPDFTLRAYGGNEYTLSELEGKIVVLDFCSHKCPFSRGIDKDITALAKTYGPKGVVFLGVDSHNNTPPDEIKEYAAKTEIPFPILKDVGNKYADALGATRTPEIYVLDKELKLAYHGAYDDRKGPDKKAEKHYVKEALDSLLAGEPVKTPEVKAWGCTIKRAQ